MQVNNTVMNAGQKETTTGKQFPKLSAHELKYKVESYRPNSVFFSRQNMKFSGDTMKNYGCRGPITILSISGELKLVYELYRRKPVKHGLKDSAYFCTETFQQTYIKE